MSSQVVSAAKRYRISQLLDTYGNQLTEKQRTFLRLYFEDDLSFGEIAREHGVSRQAIFDSVRHGEEALENLESNLGLIASGWSEVMHSGMTLTNVMQVLREIAGAITEPVVRERLENLIKHLEPGGGIPDEVEADEALEGHQDQ